MATVISEINWKEREFELIKAAMQGLLSNSAIVEIHDASTRDYISDHAILQAKSIIRKLTE